MGLAGSKPMMPAPPKVWPLEPEVELVDEVPLEDVPPVVPAAAPSSFQNCRTGCRLSPIRLSGKFDRCWCRTSLS